MNETVADPQDEQDRQRMVLASIFDRYRNQGGGRFGTGRAGRDLDPVHPRTKKDSRDSVWGTDCDRGKEEQSPPAWKPPPGIYRSKLGTGPSRFDPQSLDDVISNESNRRGWNRSLSVGTVIGQWESIVGDVVAQHCPVVSFDQGKLVVQADSSAWAQQLQLLLPQVQKRIDEVVGPRVVEQVIVRGPRAPSWKKGPRSVPGRGPRDTYG